MIFMRMRDKQMINMRQIQPLYAVIKRIGWVIQQKRTVHQGLGTGAHVLAAMTKGVAANGAGTKKRRDTGRVGRPKIL
jgi:hypothetical protein